MNPRILKYLLDIESVIAELEKIKAACQNNFNNFENDVIILRASERDFEIIGEAVKKILDMDPAIQITNTKKIIGLRNLITHAYDSIEPELLWAILLNDIPILTEEIKKIREH